MDPANTCTYILLPHKCLEDLEYNYIEEPILESFDQIPQELLYTDSLLM